MTPAAQLASTIEILDEVIACAAPAELILRRYTRARRFIGSKDRRAIQEKTFAIIRSMGLMRWHLAQIEGVEICGRNLALCHLALAPRTEPDAIAALFGADTYAPAALTPGEFELISALHTQADSSPPDWARLNIPSWLEVQLRTSFGNNFEAEMICLNEQGPVDLRVNTLKTTRDQALVDLDEEGHHGTATPHSPWGIRLGARLPWGNLAAYKDGRVEPQDEGSQILALIADAKPGQMVIDLCAGAGGKTLALAASMENSGTLIATDSDAQRLARATGRLARAGVTVAQLVPDIDNVFSQYEGQADTVLADMPCSGTGAWRRQPAARWCLTQDGLDAHCRTQTELLVRAASLVKPGGRVIYATCSVLDCENDEQVKSFEQTHPQFQRRDVRKLTPAEHGTDGVYAAVWEYLP